MLYQIIIATGLVSLVSLVSVLFVFRKDWDQRGFKALISIAAGALLAVAFLDLLPEAIELSEGLYDTHFISAIILLSILAFFMLERVLHWHHCSDDHHDHVENKHGIAIRNLIGDGLHNIIDGFLIAAAFLLDFRAGIGVTAAVILHEIPQEIFDFGILLHGGLSKLKAIIFNVLVSFTAMAGAIIFYFFGETAQHAVPIMAAIAVGNFIYLAVADLIPEMHHEQNRGKIVTHTIWLLVGVALIYGINTALPHAHVNEHGHQDQTHQLEEGHEDEIHEE